MLELPTVSLKTMVLIFHHPMKNFRKYVFRFPLKEILTYLESYKNGPTPNFSPQTSGSD